MVWISNFTLLCIINKILVIYFLSQIFIEAFDWITAIFFINLMLF
jgi:hypothetical protein